MASATATPTFSFHPTKHPKSHHLLPSKLPTTTSFPSLLKSPLTHHHLLSSLDVSKDDKPLSQPPEDPASDYDEEPNIEQEEIFDRRRRIEEKFAVLNTGIHECRSCGYRYDEVAGDPSYPIPPGLPFEKLPEDWRCATCGAAKSFFVSKSVEIAGFAQNQQFGLGGNTLTSGQKGFLIYGGLVLGFALFLSGYFLQ